MIYEACLEAKVMKWKVTKVRKVIEAPSVVMLSTQNLPKERCPGCCGSMAVLSKERVCN
jgi:hypothetical protein